MIVVVASVTFDDFKRREHREVQVRQKFQLARCESCRGSSGPIILEYSA